MSSWPGCKVQKESSIGSQRGRAVNMESRLPGSSRCWKHKCVFKRSQTDSLRRKTRFESTMLVREVGGSGGVEMFYKSAFGTKLKKDQLLRSEILKGSGGMMVATVTAYSAHMQHLHTHTCSHTRTHTIYSHTHHACSFYWRW